MGGAAGDAASAAGSGGQQFYNSLLGGAQWLDNRMPWMDTASTKAAKFRDQWSMVGAMLTSATTDKQELAFLIAGGGNPEGFMARGVKVTGRGFKGLEAQADEFGYFGVNHSVFGNQETADTLPIIQWMSPAFSNAASVVRQIPANK